jgi:diaminopimelate decarboxylase
MSKNYQEKLVAVMETKGPIYIIDEARLRSNLELISQVARRTQAEWILAFKAFALWKTFPIFREYINEIMGTVPVSTFDLFIIS